MQPVERITTSIVAGTGSFANYELASERRHCVAQQLEPKGYHMITLKTLASATAQEVFDQVAQHLLSQGQRSWSGSLCMYRHGNLRCAAGCLIGDDEYSMDFEELLWTSLVRDGIAPEEHKHLIRCLQRTHDTFGAHEWREKLIGIAREYKLEVKPYLANAE